QPAPVARTGDAVRSTRSSRSAAAADNPRSCHSSRAPATDNSAGQRSEWTNVSLPASSFVSVTCEWSDNAESIENIRCEFGWLHQDARKDSPVTMPTTLGTSLSCFSSRPYCDSAAYTDPAGSPPEFPAARGDIDNELQDIGVITSCGVDRAA